MSSASASTTTLTRPGTLTVPASVVAKIAAQAAGELFVTGSGSGGVLGLGARRDFDSRPTADAQLFGNTAVVELDLGLIYPTPLRDTVSSVREHVVRRVEELTGFSVGQVDIDISWLNMRTSTRGALL